MVYMMKYLRLPYQAVTMMSMILSLPQIVLLGIWGKISDKKGHAFVLKSSVWLFAGQLSLFFFASPESWFLFIPAAFLVGAVANAGFVISVFNRRYELMPAENRIVYDNFYTAVIGLGFILGPMLGGILKGLFESSPVLSGLMDFGSIRLLYPISAAGILLLQAGSLMIQRKQRLAAVSDGSLCSLSIGTRMFSCIWPEPGIMPHPAGTAQSPPPHSWDHFPGNQNPPFPGPPKPASLL